MNNKEFVSALAARLGIAPKEAQKRIDVLVETLATQLEQGNEVAVSGFGTFETRDRKERTGCNPHNSQPIRIAATRVPAFKPSKALKDSVSG